MSGTRLRSSVVLLALVACACSATAREIGAVPASARQTTGAGVITIVSGG